MDNKPNCLFCQGKGSTGSDLEALMEGTANLLRGMTLDMDIPKHARVAMSRRVEILEEATNQQNECRYHIVCYPPVVEKHIKSQNTENGLVSS